jgi:hypothetical protein
MKEKKKTKGPAKSKMGDDAARESGRFGRRKNEPWTKNGELCLSSTIWARGWQSPERRISPPLDYLIL